MTHFSTNVGFEDTPESSPLKRVNVMSVIRYGGRSRNESTRWPFSPSFRVFPLLFSSPSSSLSQARNPVSVRHTAEGNSALLHATCITVLSLYLMKPRWILGFFITFGSTFLGCLGPLLPAVEVEGSTHWKLVFQSSFIILYVLYSRQSIVKVSSGNLAEQLVVWLTSEGKGCGCFFLIHT